MQELCVPPKLGGVLEAPSLGCRACLSPRPLQVRPRWRFAAGGHGGSLSTSGLRGVVGGSRGGIGMLCCYNRSLHHPMGALEPDIP